MKRSDHEQWDRERREARERNEAIRRARKAEPRRPVKPGKLAAVTKSVVTWVDPPVSVGGLRVVGVCSDASDDVKAAYL
jgi:hypothetical protein